MAFHVGCLNLRSLSSSWKQGHFLNDIRSRNMDVIIATETSLKEPRDLLPLLRGYEKFISQGRPASGRVFLGVILKRNQFSKKKLIIL